MRNRTVAVFVTLLLAVFFAAGLPTHSNTADLSQPVGVSTKRLLPDYQPPTKHDAAAVASQTASSVGSPVSESLSLNVARRNHTATALADGRVIIIGGDNQDGVVGEAEMLDPASQTIAAAARPLVPRTRHAATLLADGRLLVTGGANEAGLLNSTEIFNPQTGSFSDGPRLQRARAGHSATLLENGKVLIAGGQADGTAEIFDPATNQASLLNTKMNVARQGHSAILLGDGNVLLTGGEAAGGHNLESAEVFNAKALSFYSTGSPMMIRRSHPTLRALPDGKVQVIGGDYDGTMEIYDPASGRFAAAAHLVPTADMFPATQMLSAQTRAGFIDSISYRDPNVKRLTTQSLQDTVAAFKKQVGRSQYAAAEVVGLHQAVVVGGVDDDHNYVRSALVLKSSAANVSTDKIVYLPGKAPVITGTGWQPLERLTIIRQEARLSHKRTTLQAVADEQGNFISPALTLADYQPWTTYTLTARGQSSGQIAQTTYYDAPPPGREKETFPKNLDYDFPISLRDGSTEVEAGLLRWRVTSPLTTQSRSNDVTAMATCSTVAGADFSINPSFSTIINQPCLGISGNPCGMGDVELTDGCFAFSGAFHGSASPFKFSVDQNFTAHAAFDLVLLGSLSFEQDLFAIPGLGIDFDIADIVKGDVGVVVKAKIEINLTTATKLTTSVDLTEGYEVGFDSSKNPAFFKTEKTPATSSADVTLTELGEGDAKVKLGPNLGMSLTVFDQDVGSANFGVFGFVQAIVKPTKATGSCKAGTVDLNAGVDVDADFDVASILTDSASVTLFSVEIPGFPKTFHFGTDSTPPTISNVPNIQGTTDPGTCSTTATFSPTFDDDCSGVDNGTVSVSPASGSTFPKGVTTVNISVKDQSGNLATSSFTVTVLDQAPPVLTLPSNITQGTDPNLCSAVVNYTATALDNCDGALAPSCAPPSGSHFFKGVTTVNCSAVDSSSNSSGTQSFTVTVNDTQNPTITCPNITHGTDPDVCKAVVTVAPVASDNCPNVGTPTCTPASGSTFQKGTTDVSCTVTDASSNPGSCAFTVTVNDTQAPKIACGSVAGQSANADSTCQAPVPDVRGLVQAQSLDNCTATASLTVSQSPVQGSMVSGAGAHPIDVTVTDAANNSTHCTVPFTVFDITPPTITCPADVISVAHASCPIGVSNVVTFANATVTDNCPGATFVCNPPSGATFPVGITSVTCTATDSSGNTAQCTFSVTAFSFCLQDETSPGNVVLVNALTGDFSFCCGGVPIASGRGILTTHGCIGTIDAGKGDRQVHIQWDTSANNGLGEGTAYVQKLSNKTICQITDKNMANNSCQCSSPAPPASPRKPPKQRTF